MDGGTIGSITNPVNSEDFLPPAACRHKRGDMDFVKSQNADRERMVCAIGLDVHYELNVIAQEEGSYRPRLKPFNPRMSGPACPYNYTGKFVEEHAHANMCDDPIELGREIHKQDPYDAPLYDKYDPRKVSKTVIVRDYGCKVPITLADTGRIAKAVLNHYPDQYMSFLAEFVSNTFGASMRKYLTNYQASLRRILEKPQDLYRISWGAYKSVQGGNSVVRRDDSTIRNTYMNDGTLPWDPQLNQILSEVVRSGGETMPGALSPADVFNVAECINQHIATLDDMIKVWCRGFATKERYALAMLWWLNEQGRNLTQDLALLEQQDHPDYNLIALHVPLNMYHMADVKQEDDKRKHDLSPDMNCTIRGDLSEPKKNVGQTVSYRYPVGQWTGNSDTTNVILGSGRSPYMWGWGHAANLTIHITKNSKGEPFLLCAPFLRYSVGTDALDKKLSDTSGYFHSPQLQEQPCNTEFVVQERWGTAYAGDDKGGSGARKAVENSIIPPSERRPVHTMRELALGRDDATDSSTAMYKGVSEEKYRAFMPHDGKRTIKIVTAKECEELERTFQDRPIIERCGSDGFSIVRIPLSASCKQLDPFFTNGSNCFLHTVPKGKDDPPDSLIVNSKVFGYYDFANIGSSEIFKRAFDPLCKANMKFNIDVSDIQIYHKQKGTFYPARVVIPTFQRKQNDYDAQYVSRIATDNPYHLDRTYDELFVKMTHVDWVKTSEKTDLLMSQVVPLHGKTYMKHAMRIIAIRTILSSLFGMDVAALICEEPIPTYRDGRYWDREVPGEERGSLGRWSTNSWKDSINIIDSLQGDIPLFQHKNGTILTLDETKNILYFTLLSIILDRLDSFVTLLSIKKNGSTTSDASKAAQKRLFETSKAHLVRLAYVLPNLVKSNMKIVSETLPYEFVRHEGLRELHTSLSAEVDRYDPRCFYAFNFEEYERQEEKSVGKKAFTSGVGFDRALLELILTKYDVKTKEADVRNLLRAEESNDFFNKCCAYIDELATEAAKTFDDRTSLVVQCLYRVTTDPPGERKLRGSEPFRASTVPFSAGTPSSVPVARVSNVPIVEIDSKSHFPSLPPLSHVDNIENPFRGYVPREEGGKKHFTFIPVGKHEANNATTFGNGNGTAYNTDVTHPQMFAMLDAAGLLWHARAYANPADCNRPKTTDAGQTDGMHYWCRTLAETFVSSRQSYRERNPSGLWENDVKTYPATTFPSSMIGNLCDETWRLYFPLLPFNHALREDLRRARALSIMWGSLPSYSPGVDNTGQAGAWMPLAPGHQMRLYSTVGLFSSKFRVPTNPWLSGEGSGVDLVFMQSYHSAFHCDSYLAKHFQDWVRNACRYQVPQARPGQCTYPFSQYGGTPVEADFTPHRVERCADETKQKRHSQLVYNRFGFTRPLRIGQQFHDTGLLQDMFQYEYRGFADLTSEQRSMPRSDHAYISNFLSYARNHAIIALASCNHGTEDESKPRIVRNLYRLYVDTYECMGSNPDDDSVPVVMGFEPTPVDKRDDRPVVLYAGSLACLNSKLGTFCNSAANSGERVCAMYKQVYLNDATLLFTRMLRQERRRILHDNNYLRARMKRGRSNYTRDDFNVDLLDLQDAYIEFLQSTVLGMLIESGADLNGVPLHLLEPRELEVSLTEEDTDVVGNDFLTPRTREIIAQSDFGADNLSKTQLAILSLIPPNHRVLGTLRLNQSTSVIDMEHAKKQIQKETMESNKKVWQKYSEQLVSAAFAHKFLESSGHGVDFSLDMSAVQDPLKMRFDMGLFKDPLKESENIKTRMTTTHAQSSSSLSLQARNEKLRKERGPDAVITMNTKDWHRALDAVRARVERDFRRGVANSRTKCFAALNLPAAVRRALRHEYEDGGTA